MMLYLSSTVCIQDFEYVYCHDLKLYVFGWRNLVVDVMQFIILKVANDTVAFKVLYPHKNFLYMP